MTEAALHLQQLAVHRGGRSLWGELTLAVPDRAILGIIGPNGAGKTTLIGALAGVVAVDTGRVLLDGRDITALRPRERARQIALVPQTTSRTLGLTVRDVVGIGVRAGGPGQGTQDGDAIDAALRLFEIVHLIERSVDTLSGGERQLVQLARAVAQDAQALLLDEPLAALDMAHQLTVIAALRSLADAGHTIVISLHDLSHAYNVCTELLLLTGQGEALHGGAADVLTRETMHRVYGVSIELLTGSNGHTVMAFSEQHDDRGEQ